MDPGTVTEVLKLPLENMAARHPGLTYFVAGYFLEAARVCLDRHHVSPVGFSYQNDQEEGVATIEWEPTDNQIRGAHNNETDATRDGAYILALAALEMLSGLVAVRRAETQTGADYYVAPIGAPADDLERWWRLEISGTDLSRSTVLSRTKKKVAQTLAGNSNLPAIAGVVGFKERLIILQTVEESL